MRQIASKHPIGKEAQGNINGAAAAGVVVGGLVGGLVVGSLAGTRDDKKSIRFNYIYDMNTRVTDTLTPEILMSAGAAPRSAKAIQAIKHA